MTKANERTAQRIKAACDRLMEIIPADDRAKIESLVEKVYITTSTPREEWTSAEAGKLDSGKYAIVFYISELKYQRRDFFGIIAHEFGHICAGMDGDEETKERAAQDTVRRWGIEPALRVVAVSPRQWRSV